ncbi:single-strand DNA-binding protein SSB [Jeotgalibacillus malaysiensis]|uniref:Single-stranded DNA-binding protein n=1 Tax=Jeotgalibacillus malaysiensis TaxID=1508404 RepID=A0A0B5AQD2_9BACL|nr:single-stranded DNA-binding protein [Jeotgalibacillus malaysiensis]AJD92306.1 single-strand DNA-binding protein SSB [Jeotgalibacillus malaysiensis]
MINQVTLVGRLTKDPELKEIAGNRQVLNITLAVNRPFKNQAGEFEADFIRCTIWNRNAQNTSAYCEKGSLVGIVGSIQSRSYEREDGIRQYTTEVYVETVRFMDRKRRSDDPGPFEQPIPQNTAPPPDIHLETIK